MTKKKFKSKRNQPSTRKTFPESKQTRVKGKRVDSKSLRISSDPISYENEKLAWTLSLLDLDGEWGWQSVPPGLWWDKILPKLQDYETMTWGEVQGSRSHYISFDSLYSKAQKRLIDLQIDDTDALFSLRMNGKPRIIGIRDRRVLRVIWYDPDHETCPSYLKYT